MKVGMSRLVAWSVFSLMVLAGWLAVARPAAGQAPEKGTGAAVAPAEKKLTGRLPAYYGEVVSKEQRARIYEIQARYGEQMTKLREQIAMLEKQLQVDVESVLTPAQLEQVMKRTAEAKAKRAERMARSGPAPDQGTPAQGTPAQGTPAQGTPAQGTPAQGTPGSAAQGTAGAAAQGAPATGGPQGP